MLSQAITKVILALMLMIGIDYKAEARLPREIAIAVAPTLLEIAGFKKTEIEKLKKDVIDLIYTDEGNEDIVNWAKHKGEISQKEKISSVIGQNNELALLLLPRMIPCFTGTLTIVKQYPDNFAFFWLNKDKEKICKELIERNLDEIFKEFMKSKSAKDLKKTTEKIKNNEVKEKIEIIFKLLDSMETKIDGSVVKNIKTTIDEAVKIQVVDDCDKKNLPRIFAIQKMALDIANASLKAESNKEAIGLIAILYTLEILDTYEEVGKVIQEISKTTFLSKPTIFGDQYNHRPIPHSTADGMIGDCICTTIKHLIQIAITEQDGSIITKDISNSFIKSYFDNLYNEGTVPQSAGNLSRNIHEKWFEAMTDAMAKNKWINKTNTNYTQIEVKKIATPDVHGIANILHAITIQSTKIGESLPFYNQKKETNIIADREKLENTIAGALRNLGGIQEKDLSVTVEIWPENKKLNNAWPTEKITITDYKHRKKIILGGGGIGVGHTEITVLSHLE